MRLGKLCPVHRSFIAMSGRASYILRHDEDVLILRVLRGSRNIEALLGKV
jgi:plasmid stabilization system protein ParE